MLSTYFCDQRVLMSRFGTIIMITADNSEVILPVHQASILWNGEEKEVRVLATGRRPLLGTALLEEYELVIQFTEGGLVTIEDL